MAENPLATLARLVGGVVLTQGRIGHQVLGQLLIMNTNEVAMAAAAAVVAASAGQRSAMGQIALRTVAPALAVRALHNKQEERLQRKSRRLAERERELTRLRVELHRQRWKMRHQKARAESMPGSIAVPGVRSSMPAASIPISSMPTPQASAPVAALPRAASGPSRAPESRPQLSAAKAKGSKRSGKKSPAPKKGRGGKKQR